MVQRLVTQIISDLSGDDVADGEGETVQFAYRGTSYTIDLTDKEAAAFDKSMAPYVEHATKVAAGNRKPTAASNRDSGRSRSELQNIRSWARENGYEVSDRGRIKADIVEAYHAAN